MMMIIIEEDAEVEEDAVRVAEKEEEVVEAEEDAVKVAEDVEKKAPAAEVVQ